MSATVAFCKPITFDQKKRKQTELADGAGSAPRVSPGVASDGKVKVY